MTKPIEQTGKRTCNAARERASHTRARTHTQIWGNARCVPQLKNCIICVPKYLFYVYQLRPKVSALCVSVASQSVCFMCISCVPKCLLYVYQLHPKVSALCVSVASRGVNLKHVALRLVRNCISCVPGCLLLSYLFCPKLSTARV